MSVQLTIPISGLKEGCYHFGFEIGREFFGLFEESEVKNGSLKVDLEVAKKPSHLDVDVAIEGSVEVSCDRCLELFSQPVSSRNRLVINFGEGGESDDPDEITVSADEKEHDIAQYIYECVILALPIQRLHPNDSDGNSTCDPAMLEKLSEYGGYIEEDDDKDDPRWDVLKNLKNN